jgi:DNA-binding transcriptional LysR family regulator
VELRSFSEAAADNGVTQSAASQMVSHVEEQLGAELIDRSQRPIAVLPAGEVFYRGCRKIVDQFQALKKQLRDFRASEAGQVSVASIYSVGLSHMNWFVQQFLAVSPHANVRVEYQHPDRVYELVEHGNVLLGLVSYPRDTRHLRATIWREEEIVVACSPKHVFANRESICLQDLHGQAMVGYDERLRITQAIDRALIAAEADVRVVMRFDNTEIIKRAVEIDLGFGLLPAPTLTREVAAGSLVQVRLDPTSLFRPVGIIQRRGKDLPVEAEQFVQFLLQHSFADQASEASLSAETSQVSSA